MNRIIFLLMLSLFILACQTKYENNERKIQLSNGKSFTVFFEERKINDEEKILVIEFQNDERVLKVEQVEKEVLEIWSKLEKEADKSDLTEGFIRARYFVGTDEKNNEPIYEFFIFNIEKIENGTWQIEKVN